jgi:hypothetical protein
MEFCKIGPWSESSLYGSGENFSSDIFEAGDEKEKKIDFQRKRIVLFCSSDKTLAYV